MEATDIPNELQTPGQALATIPRPAGAAWRRKGQKGSAILEGALVFLPFMAIAFAIMDYSMGIFVQSVLMHSVREGVRYAITQQTSAGGQDNSIRQVVKDNSFGFLNNSNNGLVTIRYYDPRTMTEANGVGSNAAGNICVVTVTGYPWTWFAPVWRPGNAFSFSVSSSDVMEAPPGNVLPSR
ncbi:MAG: pilus assembly protein [Acidobacteria bacterium]|nr:pilus assembly protein [Acidobacteriota bacterium]